MSARHAEQAALRREALLKAANIILVTVAPTLVSLATFACVAFSGISLHASTVFASLALFNLLRSPLSALPELFGALAHARVALARLGAVLTDGEGEGEGVGEGESEGGELGRRIEKEAGGGSDGVRGARADKTIAGSKGSSGSSAADPSRVAGSSGSSGSSGIGGAYKPPSLPAEPHLPAQSARRSPPNLVITDASFAWQPAKRPDRARDRDRDRARHRGRDRHRPEEVEARSLLPSAARETKGGGEGADDGNHDGNHDDDDDVGGGGGGGSGGGGRGGGGGDGIWNVGPINARVSAGQMLVITGEMGSGKSSVLAGILDEMHHLAGEIHICGERYAGAEPQKGSASTRQPAATIQSSTSPLFTPLIGYCGQRAWLCQGSIRENILLGRPYDEARYTRVLHAVALDVDMREWPRGDRAEVGGLPLNDR